MLVLWSMLPSSISPLDPSLYWSFSWHCIALVLLLDLSVSITLLARTWHPLHLFFSSSYSFSCPKRSMQLMLGRKIIRVSVALFQDRRRWLSMPCSLGGLVRYVLLCNECLFNGQHLDVVSLLDTINRKRWLVLPANNIYSLYILFFLSMHRDTTSICIYF